MKESLIQFKALTFDLNGDRTNPRGAIATGRQSTWNMRFLQFLRTLKSYGLLTKARNKGMVVFADDQFINQELMQMNFSDIGIPDRLTMFSGGLATVTWFREMLNHINLQDLRGDKVIQPVSLLILDINMPDITGIEVLKHVKKAYDDINEKIQKSEEVKEDSS